MRLIGNLDNKIHAERFAAFLLTKEISSHVEFENEQWEVWIRDEDLIGESTKLLNTFLKNPDGDEYRSAVDQANQIAREEEKKRQQAQKNLVDVHQRWNAPITRRAPLTVGLVVICIIVAILTNFGNSFDTPVFKALASGYVTDVQATKIVGSEGLDEFNTRLRMASIMRGEVWRTFTTIFIHHGVFHIFFNMWWLVIFGRQIEGRYGSWWMALLVLCFAIPSNISGLLVPEGIDGIPIINHGSYWLIHLGGMSGVVYGLFGYVWMKMVFDPDSGLFITPFSAAIMLGWMIFCMAPDSQAILGVNIANWAHGVGLVVGLIFGYFPKLMKDLGMGGNSGK